MNGLVLHVSISPTLALRMSPSDALDTSASRGLDKIIGICYN